MDSIVSIAAQLKALNDPTTTLRGFAAPEGSPPPELNLDMVTSSGANSKVPNPPLTARTRWKAAMVKGVDEFQLMVQPLKVVPPSPRIPQYEGRKPPGFHAALGAEQDRLDKKRPPTAEQYAMIKAMQVRINKIWQARLKREKMRMANPAYTTRDFLEPGTDKPMHKSELSRNGLALAKAMHFGYALGSAMEAEFNDEELQKGEMQRWANAEAHLSACMKYGAHVPVQAPVHKTPRPEVREWVQAERIDTLIRPLCARDVDLRDSLRQVEVLEQHELSQRIFAIREYFNARDGPIRAASARVPRTPRAPMTARPATAAESPRAVRRNAAGRPQSARPHSAP